jgi:Tubulin-tyrosine ligase family
VLQAEVSPSLLIRGGRKFHIRTYLTVVEKLHHPDLLDVYIFNRHEVRVAGVAVKDGESDRDKRAHITNGAQSNKTERLMLNTVSELTERNIQEKLEIFVAEIFYKYLFPDIARRVKLNAQEDATLSCMRKYAVAGLDLMVTEEDRIFLLEANVNPAAPPERMIDAEFREHIQGFLKDLMDLVVGLPSPNFVRAEDILAAHGKLE